MKNCKTCKHWEKGQAVWGSCKQIDEEGMIDIDATCQTCNDSDFTVTYDTHPDFGCVSWEKAQEIDNPPDMPEDDPREVR